MKASIVNIGDELLMGQVVDTNSIFIAKQLEPKGIRVSEKIAIEDSISALREAVKRLSQSNNLCIVTGGLGPTKDDKTKEGICAIWDDHLEEHEQTAEQLKKFYGRIGKEINPLRQRQAWHPSKAKVYRNEVGSASALLLKKEGCVFVFLPGVPSEIFHLFDRHLESWLAETTGSPSAIAYRFCTLSGISESELALHLQSYEQQMPETLSLAYLPKQNSIRLRLSAHGEAVQHIEHQFSTLLSEVEEYLLFQGDRSIVEELIRILQQNHWTLSTVESCTGGTLASLIVQIPGVSSVYMGSVVAYSNAMKMNEVGVSESEILAHGAVSQEVVEAMASERAKTSGTTLVISTSGIAGPSGGTPEKPKGTICIGVSFQGKVLSMKTKVRGNRKQFMQRVSELACTFALQVIHKNTPSDEQ